MKLTKNEKIKYVNLAKIYINKILNVIYNSSDEFEYKQNINYITDDFNKFILDLGSYLGKLKINHKDIKKYSVYFEDNAEQELFFENLDLTLCNKYPMEYSTNLFE